MSVLRHLILCSVFGVGMASMAWAAGSGAGAGGSGHQRAINSGLPPGEPGPSGAVNNRRAAPEPATKVPSAEPPNQSPKAQ